jgi:hypothetical protein
MEPTSGRQRLFAKALGISFDESTTAEQLSEAIDCEKQRRHEMPSKGQRHVAREWCVPITPDDKFSSVLNRLWNVALARTFVFSVARRMSGADWRFHDECPLSSEQVSRIASAVCDDPERCAFVLEMDNSLSGTRGDAWFRFGKRQAEHPAYTFVEALLAEAGMQAGPARIVTSKRTRQVQQSKGCFSVVLFLSAAAAGVAALL